MPSSLKLESHLSVEELKQRYRNSFDPVERSHYQIIWLLASGKTLNLFALQGGDSSY